MAVEIRRGGGARVESTVDPELLEQAKAAAEKAILIEAKKAEIRQFLGKDFETRTDLTDEQKVILVKKVMRETADVLNMKNSASNYESMNKVELMFASGYDKKFVATHGRVSQIIDTVLRLQSEGKIAKFEGVDVTQYIFESLDRGDDGYTSGIEVDTLDEDGEKDGDLTDIYDELHLNNIKSFYETIPIQDRPLSWGEIEEQYREEVRHLRNKKYADLKGTPYEYTVTPIELVIPERDDNGDIIMLEGGVPKVHVVHDLFAETERVTVSKKEFDYYYESIHTYQTGLQDLSTMRNQSTVDHHSEKAGHAILMQGLGGEWLYIPSSVEQAKAYALGDVPKTDVSFRATGHPHEYGEYDENTGICVTYNKFLFNIFRGKVLDHYAFGKTRERNFKNAMGMSQTEEPLVDRQNNIFWFGRKVSPNGTVQHTKVYRAMESHYDKDYTEKRGYGLTEYEKGDKIMTDIVGLHFALNPRDWIMAYYSATGFASPEQAMRGGKAAEDDRSGKPTFVFYCKLPPGGATEIGSDHTFQAGAQSQEFGELRINSFSALANYIRWRVTLGEVSQVSNPNEVEVDVIQNIQKNAVKEKKPGERGAVGEEASVERAELFDHTENAKLFGNILGEVFDTQWVSVMDILAGKEGKVTRSVAGEEKVLETEADIVGYLATVIEGKKSLYEGLRDVSKESAPEACVRYYINAMKQVATFKNVLKPNQLRSHIGVAGADAVEFTPPTRADEPPETPPAPPTDKGVPPTT